MEFIKLNTKRNQVLGPLFEWRYLGVKEIKEASGYMKSIVGLRRMLQRLEKDNFVESFSHPLTQRKFYNLTRSSWNNYTDKPWNVNPDIRVHDAIASTFLFQIRNLDFVLDSSLNYPSGKYESRTSDRMVEPDGYFTANVSGNPLTFGLEVELSRKSSAVIESKFEGYYNSESVDAAIYVFCDYQLLKIYYTYHEHFLANRLKNSRVPKIGFCYSDELGSADLQFLDMKRISAEGKECTFGSIFL